MTLISKECLDQWESEGNALRARIAELEAEREQGCSSHGCMISAPVVGTNDTKCYCPEFKIRHLLHKLKTRIAELEAERDSLRAELEEGK